MDGISKLNQLSILWDIDRVKSEIDTLRPLSREQEGRIMQKFRLDWNYHSNAIEGNSLNYGETVAFLMHGITAKGKPFKDYLDIRGHNNAIDYLLDLVRGNDSLTETDIRNLHQLLLGDPYEANALTPDGQPTKKRIVPGKYKTSPNSVLTSTGEVHYYATPEETPAKMGDLMDWYRAATTDKAVHPVVVAALFHHRFVSIHPFDDGNGRMTRLLMNLMLMKAHYPPTVIKQQDRGTYYLTLSQADAGDDEPFVSFIAENVKAGLELYLKGARGESLDEPSDLDKELALFKMEVREKEVTEEISQTPDNQREAYQNSFKPLLNQVRVVLAKFRDLFDSYKEETLSPLLRYSIAKEFDTYPNPSELDRFIDSWLLKNNSSDGVILRLSLIGFKQLPTISIAANLSFDCSAYRYRISYLTLNITQVIELRYNNFLQQDEIDKITTAIGREILISLKQKSATKPLE